MNLDDIKKLRESEDGVELKQAKNQFAYNSSRKSALGYIVALANEGGGKLILGIKENKQGPHSIVGTNAWEGYEGKLAEDVYRDLQIRIETLVLYEDEKRVLVIFVPARPLGKVLKFDDVPLMRVGEELQPMSDAQYLKILQEQEPDFSEKICEGLQIEDLDVDAIERLKLAYAQKQDNSQFTTLSNEQALSDLGLIRGAKVTNAAVILLAKESVLRQRLPQAFIQLEYRNNVDQIVFDNRESFRQPYFLAIDQLWNSINLRNGKIPVQQGAFIFDIPFFNKEVIREAINNAVVHRDYRMASEVVIKQSPTSLYITNPGGFPLGVNLKNLITINSTPRNRLLADVLAKTGIVERSGQGIDKIFYQTISESKSIPDYSHSDNYQVELRLSGIVEDKAFAMFIRKIQSERKDGDKLGVESVMALNSVRLGLNKDSLSLELLKRLENDGLIERVGKTNSQRFILSKQYFELTDTRAAYSEGKPIDDYQVGMIIINHIKEFGKGKMKDFVFLLRKFKTRAQVKYLIDKMVTDGLLDKKGIGKGTEYFEGKKMSEGIQIFQRAIELGFKEMQRLGELKDPNSPEILQKGPDKNDVQ